MGAGGAATQEYKLVGHNNFVRHNPRTDRFPIYRFHSVEFWCSDATNTYKRFQYGLGMALTAKSDQSTGNSLFASYVLQSHDCVFAFTAPYSRVAACAEPSENGPAHDAAPGQPAPPAAPPAPSGRSDVAGHSVSGKVTLPHYNAATMHEFVSRHGLAVRAMGLVVADAAVAFETSVKHGAVPVLPPTSLPAGSPNPTQTISEVKLYGDVVVRYISGDVDSQPYLAGYDPVPLPPGFYDKPKPGQLGGYSMGLKRLDHAVGNVHKLGEALAYIMGFTGFHEFSEFTAEDVGTLDSGLNSVVLANNNEYVLMPMNEPTFGTPRKSQIQTFLEQNEGPGLQHMALKTDDIFFTVREMRARSEWGGFEFMPKPSDKYYRELPAKYGAELTPDQIRQCEELGILVDKDDQGVLLQLFTKPLGDRPTVFFEIIQRMGCSRATDDAVFASGTVAPGTSACGLTAAEEAAQRPANEEQAAACGGFGKGNFSELFKRIEDYERTLTV